MIGRICQTCGHCAKREHFSHDAQARTLPDNELRCPACGDHRRYVVKHDSLGISHVTETVIFQGKRGAA